MRRWCSSIQGDIAHLLFCLSGLTIKVVPPRCSFVTQIVPDQHKLHNTSSIFLIQCLMMLFLNICTGCPFRYETWIVKFQCFPNSMGSCKRDRMAWGKSQQNIILHSMDHPVCVFRKASWERGGAGRWGIHGLFTTLNWNICAVLMRHAHKGVGWCDEILLFYIGHSFIEARTVFGNTNKDAVMRDFTIEHVTYLVPLELSRHADYKFVKKILKIKNFYY